MGSGGGKNGVRDGGREGGTGEGRGGRMEGGSRNCICLKERNQN